MVGIYKITNQCNGMIYIGQSNDIARRWAEHRRKMNSKDTQLYQAMREFGIENFSFEVVEECELTELNDKEKFYIEKYNAIADGYNMSTIENVQHKINWEMAKEIMQELKDNILSAEEISKKYKISHCLVSQINNGHMWRINTQEYPIRKKKVKEEKVERMWRCPFTREELKQQIRTTSFSEIGRNCGVSDNAVRKWCDKFNLPRRSREIKSYSNEEWSKI